MGLHALVQGKKPVKILYVHTDVPGLKLNHHGYINTILFADDQLIIRILRVRNAESLSPKASDIQ